MELTGRRLGRYQLLRLLGYGGMGEVYLATSLGAAGFEKLVTVKLLRRHHVESVERVNDLLREAFIGVRLDHENIVQVLDLGEHEGTYYLVMEYVRGFSLREVMSLAAMRKEPVAIRAAAYAVRCVADALEYMHRVRGPHRAPLGLIHRDVSPSNILLGAEGRIKLSDFGVAGMVVGSTRPGVVIGKPRYLPPEARLGQPATQGWDVYALGVVMHGALSGESEVELGASTIGPRLRPLGELRPDCPSAIVDVVARATAREPADRYPTAVAFREALDAAVPRLGDDLAYWREFVLSVYRDEAFVTRFGALPHVEDLVPELAPEPPGTSAVAYVETVVVDAARPIRFGLSPALGVGVARAQGEQVATWLRRRLDRDVRPVVVADYQALVEAVAEGEVDFAWMPPVAFVRAADRGAGLVALAQRLGRPTYESAIVVREDSPAQALADLRGRAVSFVDRESASGYLYAADLIARELGAPAEVLKELHFAGSHRAVCDGVLRGWFDAGVTYVVRDAEDRIVHSGWLDRGGSASPLRAIAFTDPIPCDALAHRPGLASGVIERLARTVTAIEAGDEEGATVLRDVFYTTAMMPADLRIYDAVRATMRRTR